MPIVDNTALFRARSKLIAARRAKEATPDETTPTTSPPLRKPSPIFKAIMSEASTLAEELTELKMLVADRRVDYLAFQGPLSVGMAEAERDAFDKDVEKALRHFQALIASLRSKVEAALTLRAEDELPHLNAVIRILDGRLKKIGQTVTELRKLRLENARQRKRYSRLSSLVEQYQDRISLRLREEGGWSIDGEPAEDGWEMPDHDETDESRINLRDDVSPRFASAFAGLTNEEESSPHVRHRKHLREEKKDREEKPKASFEEEEPPSEPTPLNDAERTQLLVENERLFERLSHVNQEVQSIEAQFYAIQRLQENFADKVEHQERVVDSIYTTAEATTTNLRDGNEWIRQAITNQAGRRVIVLFCIIVFTFTLLFLDWYNP